MYPDKSLSNTTSVTTLKQSTNRVTITFSKDDIAFSALVFKGYNVTFNLSSEKENSVKFEIKNDMR